MRSLQRHAPAPSRVTISVIERLEPRVLLSAATPSGHIAPVHAKAAFPISDIFGAAAGMPLWQNGQAVLPGSTGGDTSGASLSSGTLPLAGSGNGILLATATVSGDSSIFSVLPVLPPDGLAASILRLINPVDRHSLSVKTR